MHILVIGGGPGGYVAAIRAVQLGATVTLVEKAALGGTCLNVGCIPTKSLLHSAELYEAAKRGERAGVLANPKLDFGQVQAYKQETVTKLVKGVEGLLRANKVAVVKGEAMFAGRNAVWVKTANETQKISADKIIIASGSVPAVPPVPGIDGVCCIDSTDALALKKVPKSLVIIGGGVIGMELATAYASFGSKVSVVEMMPEILPMLDQELVNIVRKCMARTVRFMTDTKVLSVNSGEQHALVHVEQAGEQHTLECEKVLVCVGRRADTDSLNLETAGVAQERGGAILVDRNMETNVPGIYAIGDCTGGTMLAHVASAQGEAAAEHAMGYATAYEGQTAPSCVYTTPEIALVGLSEADAKRKGIEYCIGRFPLAANGRSLIINGGVGMVKAVVGAKYGQILGVGIVGPFATELIAEAALAIRLETTAEELISTIHAHPTVGESVREAVLSSKGRAIHILNR